MGLGTAIRAGRAFVEAYLKDDKLKQGLDRAERRLRAWGSSVTSAGRTLVTAAAVAAVPLAFGVREFTAFERSMANVSTMVQDTEQHMGRFKAGVRGLATDLGEGTDTLAQGLYDILSASVAPAEALGVLEVSARAAKAGITDTGVSADAVTTILNAYGLEAGKAGDVTDWLFSVVKRGKTTFGELAPNIGKVATLAATAGVSLEELGAMIALLTRAGLSTEEAIVAVSGTINAFLKPAEEGKELSRALGLEMSTATLHAEGLHGVFQRIAHLKPGEIAKIFPNVRAMRGVLPALAKLEGFGGDIDAITNRAGAMEEAFAKVAATLGTDLDRARAILRDVAIEIGEQLAPDVAALAGWVKENKDEIAGWVRALGSAVGVLARLVVGMGGVGAVMIGLGTTVNVLAGALKGLAVAFGAARTAAMLLIAHPLILTLTATTAAVVALGLAFSDTAEAASDYQRAAESALAKGDRRRAADLAQLRRLDELAKKERLNNKEMEEAGNLISHLEGYYGDLGVAIDTTTGKLTNMADVWAKTQEQMRQHALNEARADLTELLNEIRLLENQLTPSKHKTFLGTESLWDLMTAEDPATVRANLQAANIRRFDLLARISELESGATGEDVLTGQEAQPGGAPASGDADAAATAQAAAEEQQVRYGLELFHRQQQIRLGMIEDEHRRELALINERYDHEKAMAVTAGKEIAGLEQTRQMELAAARQRHARERAEEEQRAAAEIADREMALRDELERLQIERTLKGRQKKMALLALEERRALREAAEAGVDQGLVLRKYDLLRELATAQDETARQQTAAGSFSAIAALRGLGGYDVQGRIARNTQQTADRLQDLLHEAKNGQMVFG